MSIRVAPVTASSRADYQDALAIGGAFLDAVRQNRICLAFQPVVDARDGRVVFYECLMRMRGPGGEVIPAGAFVPTIEEMGLSWILDRRALELTVRELVDNPDIRLAVNVSGLTTCDRSWLDSLVALVGDRRDLAERLIVEITETAAIRDVDETAAFVATVRGLGCRVSLDDFGAGHTSFYHLQALATDIVKIDGLFVRNFLSMPDSRLLVRTLVSLARDFGLSVIAECIETEEDAQALRSEGVSYLQGYLFGAPTLDRPWRSAPSVA